MRFCSFLVMAGAGLPGCWLRPTEEEEARNTFHEREFVDDDAPGASLGDYVLLHLEPTNSVNDAPANGNAIDVDTGDVEGMDEIPYDVTEEVTMSVATALEENLGHRIELVDAKGQILALADNTMASDAATLSPGRYYIRVYHQDSGNPSAQTQALLLRTTFTSSESDKARRLAPARWGGTDYWELLCGDGSVHKSIYAGAPWKVTTCLTGNVSCASFVGAEFECFAPEYFCALYIPFKDARNASFRNCKFDYAIISGALADSEFIDCKLNEVHWGTSFRLTGTSRLTRCDFSRNSVVNVDFSGITIEDCDFQGIVTRSRTDPNYRTSFADATLRRNNFDGADLGSSSFDRVVGLFTAASGNTFNGAMMDGAGLTNMDLHEVSFADITTSWRYVNFSGSDLSGQDLSALNLAGASFAGANLDRASFRGNATLVGCDFTNANLAGVDFSGATLTGSRLNRAKANSANFENSRMDQVQAPGADFTFANFAGASLNGAVLGAAADSGALPAKMMGTYMPNVVLAHADCRFVNFSGARMYGPSASAQGAQFTSADFGNAIVSGMDFSGSILESATFNSAHAVNCKFIGAGLKNARFDNAYLLGANFSGAVAPGATFTNAAVSTAPCNGDTSRCSRCRVSACSFNQLDQANLCCYSYSEAGGVMYAVAFGPTILPSDCTMTCPNGTLPAPGACSCTTAQLKPITSLPYPPVPACVPTPTRWCP